MGLSDSQCSRVSLPLKSFCSALSAAISLSPSLSHTWSKSESGMLGVVSVSPFLCLCSQLASHFGSWEGGTWCSFSLVVTSPSSVIPLHAWSVLPLLHSLLHILNCKEASLPQEQDCHLVNEPLAGGSGKDGREEYLLIYLLGLLF